MKGTGKGAGKGALIGLAIAGVFGILTILGGSGPKDGLAVRLLLAFMVAGFYGAVPGAALGGFFGWVKGRSRGGAPSLPPAPVSMPVPVEPTTEPAPTAPATAPVPGPWIGAVGEALETRATVLSVGPYADPFATRAIRHLHYLRTASGHTLRWLANDPRGLSAGDEVILRGTVKDFTWDSNGEPVTEVWYCQTRPAPMARPVPPAPAPATPAAPRPQSDPSANSGAAEAKPQRERPPEPKAEPKADAPRPQVDRDAVIRSANEVRTKMAEENERRKVQLLAPVKPAPSPVTRSGVDLSDPQRLNRVLDELDSLPGLETVAGQVRTLANRVRLNEERRQRGMKVTAVGMHAVFVGPPGTGKTTVARVWGRVLAAVGLLPSGHVIETDRAGLVGQHVGETAQKTTKVIDSARGGVLFIDEAYSLTPDGPASNDFGSEAVDVLLKRMEDARSEFCVIVAGYPREMERFLESNTGLRSRFAQTVTFPNYDANALQTILEGMAAKDDYRIAGEAEEMLARALTRLAAAPPTGWANARSMRGLLSAMVDAQSERLATADLAEEDLGLLSEADVRAALTRHYPQAI